MNSIVILEVGCGSMASHSELVMRIIPKIVTEWGSASPSSCDLEGRLLRRDLLHHGAAVKFKALNESMPPKIASCEFKACQDAACVLC